MVIGAGSTGDANTEIALLQSVNSSGQWTVSRGVLDTTPRAWAAGTEVWFIEVTGDWIDRRTRSYSAQSRYKFLPRTALGVLAEASSAYRYITPINRHFRPTRPANVRVAATAFGTLTAAGAGPWNVTWGNRNRITEDAQILKWDDAGITAEVGQTTLVEVLNAAGTTVLKTYEAANGATSQQILKADFGGNTSVIVRVSAKRDGLLSLQSHTIAMTGIT